MSLKVSFLWSLGEKFAQQFVRLGFAIFLARILTPDDYGLVGMVSIFLLVGNAFTNGGFSQALIQKKEITAHQIGTIFWLNISISVLVYLLAFSAAPMLANYFGRPEILLASRVAAIGVILSSLGIVSEALLVRSLHFKKLAKASLFAQISSGILSLTLALNGFGFYALIFQALSSALLKSLSYMYFSIRELEFKRFSLASIQPLIPFGKYMFLNYLLNVLFNSANAAVIGKLFSAQTLGFFGQGKKLKEMFSGTINQGIQRVVFPLFSNIQGEKSKILELSEMGEKLLSIFYIGSLGLLFLLADSIVLFLFGAKWSGTTDFFRWFCVIAILYPFNAMTCNIEKSLGSAKSLFYLDLIKKSILILGVYVGFKFENMSLLLLGMLLGEVIGYGLVLILVKRNFDIDIGRIVARIVSGVLISIISGFIAFYFEMEAFGEFLNFMLKLISYLSIFIGLNLIVNRSFVKLLKTRIKF